ncbi:M48 family metallopeptidase [soil metagenome]
MSLAGAPRDVWWRSTPFRLVLSAVAMVAVAELVLVVLSPGEPGIPPAHVDQSRFFDQAELQRAANYQGGQRLLGYAGLLVQTLVGLALALGRPRRLRRLFERLGRRRLLGAIAVGAIVYLIIVVATVPTGIWAHGRAVDFGLSSQSLGSWFSDRGISLAIMLPLVAVGSMLLVALVRRLPRMWWLPAAVGACAIGAALTLLGPVLFAPAFNDFQRLPDGSALRKQVLDLGEKAGVDIGEVYKVDASRRSSTLNAYVNGLGPTKRVVLYDTLIDATHRAELRSVVAHELGHVAHDDVPRGVLFAFLVAPLGALFARELARALAIRSRIPLGSAASVPALLLAISLAAFVLGTQGNQLSRKVEASADAFALRLTDDPKAFIKLHQEFVRRNLSDPNPPAVSQFLCGTHPTGPQRIGSALAYERGR